MPSSVVAEHARSMKRAVRPNQGGAFSGFDFEPIVFERCETLTMESVEIHEDGQGSVVFLCLVAFGPPPVVMHAIALPRQVPHELKGLEIFEFETRQSHGALLKPS